MTRILRSAAWGWIVVLLSGVGIGARALNEPDASDRRILEAFLDHARRVPDEVSAGHCGTLVAKEAEAVRWRILSYLEMLIAAYDITAEPAWLDRFVRAFGNLEAALSRGSDGFLGWYGLALPGFRRPADMADD